MAVTGTEGAVLLVGRVVFGGVLAFMGLNHFLDLETMTGYAEHEGVPAPRLAVIGSGLALVLGGLAVLAGVAPAVGAVLLALFLLTSAVLVHDFWAVPEDQAQTEMTQFLKNVALAGAALAFAAFAGQEWAYSVGVSVL